MDESGTDTATPFLELCERVWGDNGTHVRSGNADDFGVSLEVSFMERKKDEDSLSKQNRILQVPIDRPIYYFAQIDGVSQRFEGTEENRQFLTRQLAAGQVRKVLVKYDIPLSQAASREQVLSQLQEAMTALIPFYEATRVI